MFKKIGFGFFSFAMMVFLTPVVAEAKRLHYEMPHRHQKYERQNSNAGSRNSDQKKENQNSSGKKRIPKRAKRK